MQAGFSLWINNEKEEKVFGMGPYNLLLLIDELGSLNKAAKAMKISYSKAIGILNKAEEELELKLLEREIGGASGGGSKVTPQAREVLGKYENYRREASLEIEKIFDRIWKE